MVARILSALRDGPDSLTDTIILLTAMPGALALLTIALGAVEAGR